MLSSLLQKLHDGSSRSFILCKYLLHVISLWEIRYWNECNFVFLVMEYRVVNVPSQSICRVGWRGDNY